MRELISEKKKLMNNSLNQIGTNSKVASFTQLISPKYLSILDGISKSENKWEAIIASHVFDHEKYFSETLEPDLQKF